MLNKNDLKTVRIISFDDWLGPIGLFFDKNSNILTLADELDRHSMLLSTNKFLHVISPNGTLVEKIYIEEDDHYDDCIKDCCMINKYLFICKEDNINCYKFI